MHTMMHCRLSLQIWGENPRFLRDAGGELPLCFSFLLERGGVKLLTLQACILSLYILFANYFTEIAESTKL